MAKLRNTTELTPFKLAWDAFVKDNAECLAWPVNGPIYLENRLLRAFTDGWNGATKAVEDVTRGAT